MHSPDTHSAVFMHYHDSMEVGLCMGGSGVFYIGGGVHSFSAGDISVIAPGVVHIAQSTEEDLSAWRFVDLDPEGVVGEGNEKLLSMALRFSGVLHPEKSESAWLVRQMLSVEQEEDFGKEKLSWLTGLLLTDMARQAEEEGAAASGRMDGISPAVAYISMHYDETMTIEQLASLCSRSVTAFRRAFERATGRTPFEYLYEVRIKAAINLLKSSDLPVSEVAGRVGYPTLSSFNRHFRRIAGRTPSFYRGKAKDE